MSHSNHYKISLVVQGKKAGRKLVDAVKAPQIGDEIRHDGRLYKIIELVELMPAGEDFGLVHATCEELG